MERAFTLIELMISTALAMLLVSVATLALLHVRQAIARAEARLGMHAAAQGLHTRLSRSLSSVQQSCAFVAMSTASSGPASGEVQLIFMRAKEDNEDWRLEKFPDDNLPVNSDLVWEAWVWRRATRTLSMGWNSPLRSYTIDQNFAPTGGIDLRTWPRTTFQSLPQPRRWLDPADPTRATAGGLDDNIYFPDPGNPRSSLANPGDVGDYTDLRDNLAPIMDQVEDLTIELVAHDGTLTTIDDSATATLVRQGVWLDGRLAPALTDPPAFATSEVAKRPRLLRLRFTATDPTSGASKTFSFSFALPGLSADS